MNQKNLEVGKSLKEKLMESKGITAGQLFKEGSFRIGKTTFDIHKDNQNAAHAEANKRLDRSTGGLLERNRCSGGSYCTSPGFI